MELVVIFLMLLSVALSVMMEHYGALPVRMIAVLPNKFIEWLPKRRSSDPPRNQGWNNVMEVTVEMVGAAIIPPTLSAVLPVMMEPSIALVMMMIVLTVLS